MPRISNRFADIDIYSPGAYADSAPHEQFAFLREHQPVFWQGTGRGGAGYWAVLRHADVVHVARNSRLFSASEGGVVIEDLDPASLENMRDMLLAMDPPRHTAYRKPIAPEFKARVISSLEPRVRAITGEIFARTLGEGVGESGGSTSAGSGVDERADPVSGESAARTSTARTSTNSVNPNTGKNTGGGSTSTGSTVNPSTNSVNPNTGKNTDGGRVVELVHDVCAHLPSQVIGELMGLPREDWARIHAMAERNSGGQDPDIADGAERGSASTEMALYAMGFAAWRRAAPPQGDLTDVLLGSLFDGRLMTDIDFGRFFVQLVTAGNDTTRTMLSSGTLALIEHPEQMAAVRRDAAAIPSMVEEVLRWANPLHYFRRTAMADTEISGQAVAAGDKVAMIYTSANRDEDVFDDPHRFDITRDPNPHLSFGIGAHFCLGVHLARLEARVFFEELLARFSRIELAGAPKRQRSNLNNALKALPVRLSP